MIIGVTGKSGSGKSTYSERIASKYNAVVVHVDEVGHQVLAEPEVIDEISNAFGNSVINENLLVNRKLLGDLIFSSRHEYEKLTAIVWSRIKEKLNYIIKNNSVVILDWLLLPHTHYWKLCDKKILVTAVNDTVRKDKVMKRDCISKEYLDARDAAGINYDNILVDEIIINNYNSNYTGGSITC